jgi:hypothetical protein
LDKLVDAYLANEVDKEVYQRKRRELVAAKMDLKTKLDGLGRSEDFRLEPAIKLINWSKELNKHVFDGNSRALAQNLQEFGLNRAILNKKLRLSVEGRFSTLARACLCTKWRP